MNHTSDGDVILTQALSDKNVPVILFDQPALQASPSEHSSADAAQQACDGASRRRLGDLRELPAETRPLPDAPDFQSGGQDISHQHQVPHHQGPEPRQLPGGGGPLPQQEGRT